MAVVYSASGGGFRILRLQEVSYLIKSTLWVPITTKRGRENGKNNLSMQGQTDYDR